MIGGAKLKDLIGLTLRSIAINEHKEQVTLTTVEGRQFIMWHCQDCCESVGLTDIPDNLDDLTGSPLVTAEKRTNSTDDPPEYAESFKWTFYEFATNKGSATFRWLGESNGYYSEDVDFDEITPTVPAASGGVG